MIFTDSRYQLAILQGKSTGELYIGSRDRLFYANMSNIEPHIVEDGDTLWSLAARYYGGEDGEANLWWVIADFQPEPILDPTIALQAGSTILIPPFSYVQNALAGLPEESIESA
jgi:hypothetical protein